MLVVDDGKESWAADGNVFDILVLTNSSIDKNSYKGEFSNLHFVICILVILSDT